MEIHKNNIAREIRPEFYGKLNEEQIRDEADERTCTLAKSSQPYHRANELLQGLLGSICPCLVRLHIAHRSRIHYFSSNLEDSISMLKRSVTDRRGF